MQMNRWVQLALFFNQGYWMSHADFNHDGFGDKREYEFEFLANAETSVCDQQDFGAEYKTFKDWEWVNISLPVI